MKKAVLFLLICLAFSSCKEDDNGGSMTPCEISQTVMSLMERTSEQLTVKNAGVYGATPEFIWTSSNDKVATVDGGLVKAVSPGTTEIRVSIADHYQKTVSAVCSVTVGSVAATALKVTIPTDSLTISIGDTVRTSTFAFTPLETSGQKVSIVRSDSIGEKLIQLDITKPSAAPSTAGEFTFVGLRAGTVNVEFKADNQKDISAKFTIVVESIPVTAMSLPGDYDNPIVVVSGQKGGTVIHATLTPAKNTSKLKWKLVGVEPMAKIVSSAGDSVVVDGLLPADYGYASNEKLLVAVEGILVETWLQIHPAEAPKAVYPTAVATVDTLYVPFGQYATAPIKLTPSDANVHYDHCGVKVDAAYKLPEKGVLANSLDCYFFEDAGQYAIGATATFGQTTQGSMNAYKLYTAGKLTNDGNGGWMIAAEDTIFSKSIVMIVGNDIPETEVSFKAAYTFSDAKVNVAAILTPTPSYGVGDVLSSYSNLKATLLVAKGTAINSYEKKALAIADDELKDGKLIKNKTIETVNLNQSIGHFTANFKPFTKTVALDNYRVSYVFDYWKVQGYKAECSLGTDTAPFAPRR